MGSRGLNRFECFFVPANDGSPRYARLPRFTRSRNPRSGLRTIALGFAAIGLVLVGAGALGGCKADDQVAPPISPGSPFNGPNYLNGSIGSYCRVEGSDSMIVSGYGLVVNLPGTGSPEIPQFLRQRLETLVRRQNLLDRPELRGFTPERFLRRTDNAIVEVYGLIPPGATPGTTFDLVIRALDADAQTTSLAGGLLMTVDLAVGGANPQGLFATPRAQGDGSIFANPIDVNDARAALGSDFDAELMDDFSRQAVVPNGGRATRVRNIRLVLNQASFARAASIADRINSTLYLEPGERGRTANARTDLYIDLQVPRRFRDRSEEFVNLVMFTFLQSQSEFQSVKAQDLLRRLRESSANSQRGNPAAQQATQTLADQVLYGFRAMGKTVLPTLRTAYDDEDPLVRRIVLEAGVYLEDPRAIEPLIEAALRSPPALRASMAISLARLARVPAAGMALRQLVDDDDASVRIAAYEAMADVGHPQLLRTGIYGEADLKFIIDEMPWTRESMVYITQKGVPRIAIFGSDPVMAPPITASLWDNRLMLRSDPAPMPRVRDLFGHEVLVRGPKGASPVEVFHRGRGADGSVQHAILPTLTNFIKLLGHKPSARRPQDGLDMTYAQVVEAVYSLSDSGVIPTDVRLDLNPLVEVLTRRRDAPEVELRPETELPQDGLPALGSEPGLPEAVSDVDAIVEEANAAVGPLG